MAQDKKAKMTTHTIETIAPYRIHPYTLELCGVHECVRDCPSQTEVLVHQVFSVE